MKLVRISLLITALFATGISLPALAAPPDCQASGESGRALLLANLRYAGIEQTPSPELLDKLAAAWCKAQQPGLSPDDHKSGLRDMYFALSEIRGRPITNPHALDGLVGFADTIIEAGAKMDLTLPEPRGPIGDAKLDIQKFGSGPVPVVMIADLGVDGRFMYRSFAERNASKYTVYVVNLPGAGSAPPLPWPEQLDYTATPWLNAIDRALGAYLDSWKKPVVLVGSSGGGYFAARLATERPQALRAVILVNALVSAPLRSRAKTDSPAPFAERQALLRTRSSMPQFFPAADTPPRAEIERILSDPSPKIPHPTVQNWMAFGVKDDALSKQMTIDALSKGFFLPGGRYGAELQATDLTDPLAALQVPTLVMASFYDDGSSQQGTPTVAQWEELKLRYPQIPLTLATYSDTRAYLTDDSPADFDRDFDAFLNHRPPQGKSTWNHQPRLSPRASTLQAVGATEIEINYSRPQVKGRKIFGELVPFGRVWRTGANEATTIRFSSPVSIDGHQLAAGRYSFFTIPVGDGNWTVIFNKVPDQWGAFNYNSEFDALRITLKTAESAPVEALRFAIDPQDATHAAVTVAWANRALSFTVQTQP